jgi:hypothetical protein
MKSAYELAMERLEKSSPSVSLTEDQKKEIAEVDSLYRAKIAEKELFLKDQIRKAQVAGKFEELESLDKQLVSEIRRLHEECEAKKEKLRASFGELTAPAILHDQRRAMPPAPPCDILFRFRPSDPSTPRVL